MLSMIFNKDWKGENVGKNKEEAPLKMLQTGVFSKLMCES